MRTVPKKPRLAIPVNWDGIKPPPQGEECLVSWSGGIESTSLMIWLAKNGAIPVGFHVEYGQKATEGERKSIEYWSDKYSFDYKIFECAFNELAPSAICHGTGVNVENDVWHNVLEGRNLAFLSLAVMYASARGIEHVFIGYNWEPYDRPYPDSSIESWLLFQALVTASIRNPMTIHAPFAALERIEILKNARVMDDEIGIKTFSCFEKSDGHCGVCEHCLKQKKMLGELGVVWP